MMQTTSEKVEREECLVVTRTPEVLGIRLNRPYRLNAFSRDMYVQFDSLVTEAAHDPGLRMVVLTGTGRAFSSGGDLKEHMERRRRHEHWDPREYIQPSNHAFETLINMDKVVLAVVNGLAYGSGLIVTLCSDIAICVDDAKFCVPEANSGRAEPWTAGLLPWRVGRQRAAAMVLTGEPIDAAQALAYGIVHRVVPPKSLWSAAEQIVNEVLRGAPDAVRWYKRVLVQQGLSRFELSASHQTIFSEETLEGTGAFVDHREPAWVRTWATPSALAEGTAI